MGIIEWGWSQGAAGANHLPRSVQPAGLPHYLKRVTLQVFRDDIGPAFVLDLNEFQQKRMIQHTPDFLFTLESSEEPRIGA